MCLATGVILDMMKECRTVLISKSALPEHQKDINSWRPITIGSIILRLFSRILTVRLSKACPINTRQRGFIKSSGCMENLKLLQLLIRSAKWEYRPLGVVFVDLAKAFDTVSRDHIMMALKQKVVDDHIISLITNMYRNVNTRIHLRNDQSDPIRIHTGVKQGDPMSPILFNLSIDPLLCKLKSEGSWFQHYKRNITAMAFADDLVLLSGSWDEMKEYYNTRGLL